LNVFLQAKVAVRNLTDHRFLLKTLIQRELSSRYRGSTAGLLWSLLLPCCMLAIYYFVFGYINQPVRHNFFSQEGGNIALTLFAGLNLHALLAECLSRAPQAIMTQPSYVKRVVFPLHLLPFTVLGAAFVQYLLASGILFVAHFWLHGFSWALLAWPRAEVLRGSKTVSKQAMASLLRLRRLASADDFNCV
jgi:lipopolysaccharide transport system permease protein